MTPSILNPTFAALRVGAKIAKLNAKDSRPFRAATEALVSLNASIQCKVESVDDDTWGSSRRLLPTEVVSTIDRYSGRVETVTLPQILRPRMSAGVLDQWSPASRRNLKSTGSQTDACLLDDLEVLHEVGLNLVLDLLRLRIISS